MTCYAESCLCAMLPNATVEQNDTSLSSSDVYVYCTRFCSFHSADLSDSSQHITAILPRCHPSGTDPVILAQSTKEAFCRQGFNPWPPPQTLDHPAAIACMGKSMLVQYSIYYYDCSRGKTDFESAPSFWPGPQMQDTTPDISAT